MGERDTSSVDFKLRFAIKHPFISLKWLLRLDRQSLYEAIRDEGIKYLLSFLGRKANVGFLRERTNELQGIVEESLRKRSKADLSGMRWVKGPLLYVLVKVLRPCVIIETGVASGISTLFILQALNDNLFGTLYSIDLPNVGEALEIPEGLGSGWAVPNNLKGRWVLVTGDSRHELPKLLKKLGKIDVFLHDSLHTYEHMMWEFGTAWPHIAQGGILTSDDARANSAFIEFVKHFRAKHTVIGGLGLARKGVPC